MDAIDLTNKGFGKWASFSAASEREILSGLPTAPGVYAILLCQSQACGRASSEIAYVGRAVNQGGLRGRVRQYFHPGPTQSTNIAMKQRLFDPSLALRLGFIVTTTTAAAKRLESDLLIEFEAQHRQLPPYNRQRALDLMSRIGLLREGAEGSAG